MPFFLDMPVERGSVLIVVFGPHLTYPRLKLLGDLIYKMPRHFLKCRDHISNGHRRGWHRRLQQN